jgi:hypothetical protein
VKRFVASIIVVLAVTASAMYARGEGGGLGKGRKRNGWNAFGKCVSARNKET